MPYNPDADDDSYIGASDILGLLPLYGQQFGIDSSLTCDYDGTTFEEWISAVFDQTIIIDSVMVQYHVLDSGLVFLPGCPDPVMETADLERAWTLPLNSFNSGTVSSVLCQAHTNSTGWRKVTFIYDSSNGAYQFTVRDDEIAVAGLTGILGSKNCNASWTSEALNYLVWHLPFPSQYSYSESGLEFDSWSGFFSSATYANILPYWHYAE